MFLKKKKFNQTGKKCLILVKFLNNKDRLVLVCDETNAGCC